MNECPRCGRLPGNSHTEICALQGEIERLRHDIKRHIAMASELATENEGLRDELARKAEGYTRLAEVHEGAMKMWESDERECAMKAYEMAAELKGLREEVERLRAELASWQEAFGLLTTLHGSIQIDSSDPMGMAKQVESHVRAELAEARKPDCRTCRHYYEMEEDCFLHRRSTPIVCINGDAYVSHGEPVRLYEIDAALAGGGHG